MRERLALSQAAMHEIEPRSFSSSLPPRPPSLAANGTEVKRKGEISCASESFFRSPSRFTLRWIQMNFIQYVLRGIVD